MITRRKDPDVLDTSKPILQAPVYPRFPENTGKHRMPKDDPSLFKGREKKAAIQTEKNDTAPVDSLDEN